MKIIFLAQIIVSVLLVALILLQKGKGSGQIIGSEGRFYRTMHGVEKKVFWTTALLAFLFIVLNLLNLLF